MTLKQIRNNISGSGFELEQIPKDKYHKGVNLKYFEMRGKYIKKTLPDELKDFGSADHIITEDGYVIRNIHDFLGQVKSFKDGL